MYDPCSFCPKGEYSQPCCSVQCSYGRDLDELKMLREQVKKLAEVVGGELVQGIDADTCAIEDLQTLLRNDFHAIGIVTVIRAINALKEQSRNKMPLTIEEVKALSDKVEKDVKDAVDSCGESHGVVEAIGVQREMEVKRDAANARAAADRDIKIAEANAAKEANDAEVASKKAIAEKNNELALRQAELKAAEDKAAAEADAAGKIEEQVQAKTIKERTADAEIAAETKKIELAARAAEVERERLNAEVQKKADAALYESQRKADAQEYAQRKNADAALYAKQQEAEGIRKVAEAEAAGIKAKGIAEAEAMEKKAEAYKKYGQAAMAEMVVKILPDMAAQVAKSIEQIDKITIYGSDESAANSVDGVAGNVPTLLAKTFDTVKDATGIDLVDIVNAQSYDAQVNRHVKLDVASLPDMNKQSSQGTELKSNGTPDAPVDKK